VTPDPKKKTKVTVRDLETVLHVLAKFDANSKARRQQALVSVTISFLYLAQLLGVSYIRYLPLLTGSCQGCAKVILKCWSFLNNKPMPELLEACDASGQVPDTKRAL
jgi:hypothetical protein